jgi:hypothetical protein
VLVVAEAEDGCATAAVLMIEQSVERIAAGMRWLGGGWRFRYAAKRMMAGWFDG